MEAVLREVEALSASPAPRDIGPQLYRLQQKALELKHPMRFRVHQVLLELEASERAVARLRARESVLAKEVEDLQRRIGDLEADQGLERQRYEEELDRLTRELGETEAQFREAEERCESLEEALTRARDEAAASEEASATLLVDVADQRESGPDLLTLLEALVQAYAEARTDDQRAHVLEQIGSLAPQSVAAALAILAGRYPDIEPKPFLLPSVSPSRATRS
ncbi:hypothetical protein [Streptomyces sp. NPDC051452]|uniref:hypothetical protein n=1 Tax=Streptomyces sp. NPDC051452 TaxID=3365654 RepID=UPI0037A6CC54